MPFQKRYDASNPSPWEQGWVKGRWATKDVPLNPFPSGTHESLRWHKGYQKGKDDARDVYLEQQAEAEEVRKEANAPWDRMKEQLAEANVFCDETLQALDNLLDDLRDQIEKE